MKIRKPNSGNRRFTTKWLNRTDVIIEILEKRELLTTYYVSSINDSGIGSLRQAVLDASNTPGDDNIEFSSSTFSVPRTINLLSSIRINDSTGAIKIQGTGTDKLTISGRNLNRIFEVNTPLSLLNLKLDSGNAGTGLNSGGAIKTDSRIFLDQVEITNCVASYGGAISINGMVNPSAGLTIQNSKISNCTAYSSGGFIDSVGNFATVNILIHNSTIENCISTDGGAIRNVIPESGGNLGLPKLNIKDSVFRSCQANEEGGAIYNNGAIDITDSLFQFNISNITGGAITTYNQARIVGSTFSDNSTGNEGGALFLHGNGALEKSTFTRNIADCGGGIFAWGVQGNINQCTISLNSARRLDSQEAKGGGGLFNKVPPASWGPQPFLSINGVLLINNTAAGLANDLYMDRYRNDMNSSYSVIGSAAGFLGAPSFNGIGNQVNIQPFATGSFGNYGGKTPTIPILAGSPAFATGNPSVIGTKDQRGIHYSSADIGAYARQIASMIIAVAGSNQSSVINGAFTGPLQAKVVDAFGNAIPNVPVTFSGPASGASVKFNYISPAISDLNGIATSSAMLANGVIGTYMASATTPGATAATFSLTNMAPTVQSMVVQQGAAGRSFVQYVDLVINDAATAAAIASSANGSASRISLTNTGLTGTSKTVVALKGLVSAIGNTIRLNYGSKGIGGNATSNKADGSYLMSLDLDGNGSRETSLRFHRLLGDVNGDKVVDAKDTALVNANLNKSGLNIPGDTNGDGKVNSNDLNYVRRAQRRKISV